MKILYAAGNNSGSKIQLSRFLQAMQETKHQIKISAYKISSPKHLHIDWTLDCLYNVFKPDYISLENQNLETYYKQVKYYKPDLVISDMDFFTSHVAHILNIELWQCSSSLINFAIEYKYDVGLFRKYSFLLKKNNFARAQREVNTIATSDYNFIYSHLCDTQEPPKIKSNFEWVRPYHLIGKKSVPCQHNVIAGMFRNNKKILSLLNKQKDCVAFTEFPHERYDNLWLKTIENQEEYFCNLKNSNLFVCEGQTSFLADAFYNKKYSLTMTDFQDLECVVNSIYSEYVKSSSIIYNSDIKLETFLDNKIEVHHNKKVKYLHQKISDLC